MSAAAQPTQPTGQVFQSIYPTIEHRAKVTLCSIYPAELRKELPYGHPRTNPDGSAAIDPQGRPLWDMRITYVLPAAEQGNYTTLKVLDTFQLVMGPEGPDKPLVPAPTPCHIVADALVREWCSDAIGAGSGETIGVGIIAGEDPTETEVAQLRAKQTNYFRHLVGLGWKHHQANEHNSITDLHRRAVNWLGAQDVPWAQQIERQEMKLCLACARKIKTEATVCEHCSTDLVDLAIRRQYGAEQLADDPYLAREIQRHHDLRQANAPTQEIPDPVRAERLRRSEAAVDSNPEGRPATFEDRYVPKKGADPPPTNLP